MASLTCGACGGSRFERQGRANTALPGLHTMRPQERKKVALDVQNENERRYLKSKETTPQP